MDQSVRLRPPPPRGDGDNGLVSSCPTDKGSASQFIAPPALAPPSVHGPRPSIRIAPHPPDVEPLPGVPRQVRPVTRLLQVDDLALMEPDHITQEFWQRLDNGLVDVALVVVEEGSLLELPQICSVELHRNQM